MSQIAVLAPCSALFSKPRRKTKEKCNCSAPVYEITGVGMTLRQALCQKHIGAWKKQYPAAKFEMVTEEAR